MIRSSQSLLALVAFALVLGGPFCRVLAAPTNLEKEIGVLRASNAAWQRELASFRGARAKGALSGGELNDYAAFVAGLRANVLVQCEKVRGLGGEAALGEFDCKIPTDEQAVAVVVTGQGVQTEEEKIRARERRLQDLETSIDEELLRRQQEIREMVKPNGGGGGGGGASAGSSGQGAASSSGSKESGAASSGSASASSAGVKWSDPGASGTAGTRSPSNGASAPPSSAPRPNAAKREENRDPSNEDDVVARQLREAAERETDPVLKQKLMEEYRKYKEAKR
jgi:hypothetical protein